MLALAWFTPFASLALGLAVSFTVGAPVLLALVAMLVHRVRSEEKITRQLTPAEPAAA